MSDIAIATLILAAATLVHAIATMTSPVLRFIELRKSQPTSRPSKKKATGILIRLIKFGWFPLLLTLGSAALLIREMRSTSPVNRSAVFLLSMLVAFVISTPFVTILAFGLTQLVEGLRETSLLQLQIHKNTDDHIADVENFLLTVTDALKESLNKDSANFEKIQTALKRRRKSPK